MTLQTAQGVFYPDYSQYGRLMNGFSSFFPAVLIDASTEKAAFIFRAPKTGNIARVGFRTATVTTGDTLKVSLQGVDLATGDPDGVIGQFRTIVVANGDSNTWFRTGLVTSDGTDGGTKRAVTRGDRLAVVIGYNAYVAGNLNIAGMSSIGGTSSPFMGEYYMDAFIGVPAWAKVDAIVGVIAVEYDDGTFAYLPNTLPVDNLSSDAYGTGSAPNELALRFSVPFACKVMGFYAAANINGDADFVLYDSDGTTVLATQSIDKDVKVSGAASTSGLFPSDATLTASTFYRLALKPTTATVVTLRWFTVPNTPGVAQLDQLSGGQNCHWSQRTGAGAWTDTTTKRPAIGLILGALDDGVGAGGMSRARIVNAGGV